MDDQKKIEQLMAHYEDLSNEAQNAIKQAYEIGRADTLAQLGIEESDLQSIDGYMAWSS